MAHVIQKKHNFQQEIIFVTYKDTAESIFEEK